MRCWMIPLGLLMILMAVISIYTIPIQQAITFTETRSEQPRLLYMPVTQNSEFQIRYVHSIFLTDVIESYRIEPDDSLRFLTMQYEDVGIGLPGAAEKGEHLSVTNEGIYTLTYENKVIDSFVLYIGDVDAQLAIHYEGGEIDLKAALERGKSYEFRVKKLTLYEQLKGVNLNGKEK